MKDADLRRLVAGLSDEEALAVLYDWKGVWARPQQLPPPGDWLVWLLLAGRGFGKTRTGAEFIIDQVQHGGYRRVALVAPAAGAARDVMVEGESGILTVSPPWFRPIYEPSKRRLTWPNGAIATTYGAYTQEDVERLRGPSHDLAWCDEPASWRKPEAWDHLLLGLRVGSDARVVVTATPKPIKLIKTILAQATTVTTRGTTYDNLENLAPAFAAQIIAKYEGTRLGRQEIYAEILEDAEGALWRRAWIDDTRTTDHPDLFRVVVGVDPPGSVAEAGIVAAGVGPCDCKGPTEHHGFVLNDASTAGSPRTWGRAAVTAYGKTDADRILGEANFGGDMVESTIATVDPNVAYKAVHASRGKAVRAEPVSALYEKGNVHHVGAYPELEDELCSWEPNTGAPSPNRLDALVWALTEIMVETGPIEEVVKYEDRYVISEY